MSNLLRANLRLLRQNRVFQLCAIVGAALAAVACVSQYINVRTLSLVVYSDGLMLGFPVISCFAVAVYTGVFLGTEYSDGTLRSRIISGHRREHVYLAAFFSVAVGGLVLDLLMLAVIAAVAVPLFGPFYLPAGVIALCLLDGMMVTVACAAVYTLLAMTVPSRTASTLLCVVVLIALMCLGTMIISRLAEPEFTSGFAMSINGEFVPTGDTPNPLYLTGTKRALFQFFADALPTSQALMLARQALVHPWLMPVYSLAITVLATGLGITLFRRKDLH